MQFQDVFEAAFRDLLPLSSLSLSVSPFLPPSKRDSMAGAPLPLARSLPSPPCLLFCAASLCKRCSRKIAGRSYNYKVCRRILASGARIHGPLISYNPLAQVMLTVRTLMQDPCKKNTPFLQSSLSLFLLTLTFPKRGVNLILARFGWDRPRARFSHCATRSRSIGHRGRIS